MPKYATGNLKNKENQGYNSVWGQRLEKCGCEFLSVCVCVCVCVWNQEFFWLQGQGKISS